MTSIKTSVYLGISVDGYIARPDGSVDFLDNHAPPETDLGFGDFLGSVDVLVMGRNTFDFVMNAGVEWPYGDTLVTVLTHRPLDLPAVFVGNVEVSDLDVLALVEYLGERGFQHAYVDGGQTVQQFLVAGLVDELTLTTVPDLIGEGISLFPHLTSDVRLELIASSSEKNGFVQSHYRVLRN